jgi:hypothetical protein
MNDIRTNRDKIFEFKTIEEIKIIFIEFIKYLIPIIIKIIYDLLCKY